ncbi:MAG: hypothetical protein ACOCWK_08345 [Tangfeifania sp.]
MKNQIAFILFAILFVLAGCEKDENENEYLVSENFSDESHNTGQDCMECHVAGGDADGWFTVAGSVYDPQLEEPVENGVIELTTEAQSEGSIIATIEIDANGNFYTTEPIIIADGLYATVESQKGNKEYMLTQVTNGSCNSCHGESTDKIWVD